jgi:hypothetical protein
MTGRPRRAFVVASFALLHLSQRAGGIVISRKVGHCRRSVCHILTFRILDAIGKEFISLGAYRLVREAQLFSTLDQLEPV